ncbi:hypothetical protein CXT99_06590 [Akkermansia muciniphila]|jgi:transcriptional regulator with XRE-family HTH domain|nr:hypothetical protein CXU00_04505 [Akkermansia muciniphila]PNC67092.1 hypothetical protein CXT99_06590 [Akkermansia muciniphila]QAT91960.1 XRE family transcriptional regulator [Akkermansia muciniphila]
MQGKNIRKTVFASRLRSFMASKSLTQMQLQEMSGISQGAISDYLKGKSEPKAAALYQLSRIFGVSMDCLWGVTDEANAEPLLKAQQEITRLKSKLRSARKTLEGAYSLALEALELEEEKENVK